MAPFKASPEFESAASYLTKGPSLVDTPNATKLELYGLYKVLTISPEPQTSRPSIFDLTGRAKWDAWKNAGLKWRGNELEAEKHYIEIAKGLGWTFNNSGLVITEILDAEELSAEELLARDSFEDDTSPKGSGGLGLGVSTMQRCSPVSSEEPTLHTLAIDGDLPKLQKFLEEHPNVELNDVDEFGYTPLHLAADRGNEFMVRFLLERNVDITTKDNDGLSALDLAQEANHTAIVQLLEDRR